MPSIEIRPPHITPEIREAIGRFVRSFDEVEFHGDKITFRKNSTAFEVNTTSRNFRENTSGLDEAARADNLRTSLDNDPDATLNDVETIGDTLPKNVEDVKTKERDPTNPTPRTTDPTPPGQTPKVEKNPATANRYQRVKDILVILGLAAPYIFAASEITAISICAGNRNVDNAHAPIERLASYQDNQLLISFKPTSGVMPAVNDIIILDNVPQSCLTPDSTLDTTDMWRFVGRIKGFTNLFIIEREPSTQPMNIKPLDGDYDYGTCIYRTSFDNQVRSCINDQVGWIMGVIADAINAGKNAVCDLMPKLPILCTKTNWLLVAGLVIVLIVILVVISKIL